MAESPPFPPPIESMEWQLVSNVGLFRSPLTGSVQRLARSGAFWQCHVSMRNLTETEIRQWTAFLAYVQDEATTFFWSPYPNGRPLAYLTGSTIAWGAGGLHPKVDGPSQTGTILDAQGFVAGATMKRGDWFSLSTGSGYELKRLKADVTANGSGLATLTIVPAIRSSPADSEDLRFDGHNAALGSRCVGEFMLVDNQQAGWQASFDYTNSLEFTIREALVA